MNLPAVQERHQLSAADIRANVNLIQEVMAAVMKGPSKDNPEGVHYGVIPGTKKPTLLKPGAEKIAATFRIAPSYQIEELSSGEGGFVRYRVRCIGTHQTTGIVLGEGMGECSSLEEKYKWRKASSNSEFEATDERRRRIKYGYNEIKQVRSESADQANTILKMACKRALVAMILTVTAASDIFTQDIEDLPPEMRPTEEPQQAQVEQPQPKKTPAAAAQGNDGATADSRDASTGGEAPTEKKLSDGAKATLEREMKRVSRTEADLAAAGFPKVADMPFSKFNDAMTWLKKNPAKA